MKCLGYGYASLFFILVWVGSVSPANATLFEWDGLFGQRCQTFHNSYPFRQPSFLLKSL